MGIGIDDLVVIGIIVVYQVEHLLRIVLCWLNWIIDMIVHFITLIVHYEMAKTKYDFGLFGLSLGIRKGEFSFRIQLKIR